MAEQANDDLLPKGLRFFNPSETAPDFVMGTLIITPKDLVDYIKAHPDYLKDHESGRQLHVQLLLSKAGKLYGKVDTYKKEDTPAGKKPPRPGTPATDAAPEKVSEAGSEDDDLPF